MKKRTDVYAEITIYDYGTLDWRGETAERTRHVLIENEQEAAELCCQYAQRVSFRTYEVEARTIKGKDYKSDPENYSETRHVIGREILSKADVIACLPSNDTDLENQKYHRAVETALFVTSPRKGYIELTEGMKVFSRQTGRLLWPIEPAPPVAQDSPKAAAALPG